MRTFVDIKYRIQYASLRVMTCQEPEEIRVKQKFII